MHIGYSCACSATMAESEKARLRKGSGLYLYPLPAHFHEVIESGHQRIISPAANCVTVSPRRIRYHQHQPSLTSM